MKKEFGSQFSKQFTKRIGKKITTKINTALNDSKVGQSAISAVQTAAQTAAQGAKVGLDQVLLGLQHRGVIKTSDSEVLIQDLMQKVGRNVLTRAESIRSQIASTPFSPAWLKEISLTPDSKEEAGFSAEANDDESELANAIREETAIDTIEAALIHEDAVTSEGAGSMTTASVSEPAQGMLPMEQEKAPKRTASKAKRATAKNAKAKSTRSSHVNE